MGKGKGKGKGDKDDKEDKPDNPEDLQKFKEEYSKDRLKMNDDKANVKIIKARQRIQQTLIYQSWTILR